MSEDQYRYWSDYIGTLLPPLRLQCWRVALNRELADVEEWVDARMFVEFSYQTASISLTEKFLGLDGVEQRAILAHELVHLHTHRFKHFADKLAEHLSPQARELAEDRIYDLMEHEVEELSRVIAPFLPLPPRAKEKAA